MAKEKKEKKNKKISKMNITEIDAALKKAKDSNNNDMSKYVQHLLSRKLEVQSKKSV